MPCIYSCVGLKPDMSVSSVPQGPLRWSLLLVLALGLLAAIPAASGGVIGPNDHRLLTPASANDSTAPVPAAPSKAALDSTKVPPSQVQGTIGQSDYDPVASADYSIGQLSQAAAAPFSCPALNSAVSAPGCPCTMHTNRAQPQGQSQQTQPSSLVSRPLLDQSSRSSSSTELNVCPAGYRCSPSAAADIMQAGWQPAASLRNSGWRNASSFGSSNSGLGLATATTGICVACQLGEYCPPGTQEETWLSLTGCELDPIPSDSQGGSSSLTSRSGSGAGSGASCKGFKACPAGSYCPDASTATPCEPGRFCPEASITSQPCNISGLLVWNPFRTVTSDPATILEHLVNSGQPLAGNTCPANASSPLSGCPAGYFCPNAASQLPCPIAYYCPGHTTTPIPCPTLASCNNPKMSSPEWSWLGLLFLLLLLLALLTLLEYVRVAGRRGNKAMTQDEEIMQLIGAVGFKMVCNGDSCSLQRTSGLHMTKHTGFRQQVSEQATKMVRHPMSAARSWASKVFRSLDLRSRSRGDLGDSDHKDQRLINGFDLGPRTGAKSLDSDGSGSSGAAAVDIAGTKDHTVLTIPDEQQQQGDENAVAPAAAAAAADGEYQINPRLTLVFRDVWVADRPLEKGWTSTATSAAAELCGVSNNSVKGSKAFDPSSREAHLACAASRGIKFIVPGVSGRFVHSQLHALMGPSGCGKTTLCKALAGRIHGSRVCGDVRVMASSAADGFTSKTELAMSGSLAACHVACSVGHMTGFVPQFDLLHETLTVQENLMQAASLRLPVSSHTRSRAQRKREVKGVVGEVTALMALNKVIHQVVGSSTQRMLSGGQRKRVAIGVELVAKPSLLWLDEPTSGLDAAVAYDVVEALKNSSQRGMNILAVMHQPRCSIFNMFDSCLLLSSNGHVVYSGPRELSLHYMAFVGFYKQPEENTADFLMDVIAGVVPRPGDPDYVPSQLATLWQRCGNIWLQQTQRQQQDFNQGSCLMSRQDSAYKNFGLAGLPVPTAAASAGVVDWPWRPRDLEGLLARFHLLVDYDTVDASVDESKGLSGAGMTGFRSSGKGGSTVMSYEGFLTFWDEAGVKDVMGEEQFAEFILGICDDFGMAPGKSITQAQFLEVLKAQLRAAAGAAPLPADHDAAPPETRLDQDQFDAAEEAAAAVAEIHASTASSGLPSPFEAYQDADHAAHHDVSTAAAAAAAAVATSSGEQKAEGSAEAPVLSERCAAIKEYHSAAKALAAVAKDSGGPATAEEAVPDLCRAAAAGDAAAAEVVAAVKQAAAAAEKHGATTAEEFCATARAAQAAAEAAGLGSVRSDLSRSATGNLSSVTSGLYGNKVCQPGMLTCSAARMQQRMLQRQQSSTQAPAAAAVSRSSSMNPQQLQDRQRALEAVARFKKARRALVKQQRRQQTGMMQLEQVRKMRTNSDQPVLDMPARNCESLEDARGKCLNTLGDYMLLQHMQQQQERSAELDQLGSRGLDSGGFMGPDHSGVPSLETLREHPTLERATPPSEQAPTPSKDCTAAPADPAAAAANSAAAAAAVLSRRLPSTAVQLRLVIKRSARKLISCRHALMTDLLLTSVLGLALGVAQGRTADPGGSLLWMLITLLAYGCMMLTRSTISYGLERHIYLQLENQGGVSPTAWVFGHQIFDIFALLLHPLLFFAWMYVLTLTPVPGWSYYIVLLVVGWYTSGIGYLVSLLVSPGNVMITGLALALLLGGVANGVAPALWQLEASNPIVWLDALSYTRWGLQALYISWLTPSPAEKAPATAAFLSGLGFCGLQPSLLQALQHSGGDSGGANKAPGSTFNTSTISSQNLWNLTSSERADALAGAAADNLRQSPPGAQQGAAAAAAMTQLWQYYSNPSLLTWQCDRERYKAYFVLLGLGAIMRLLVWVVVKWKTRNKAQE